MSTRTYGWKKDRKDTRDYRFRIPQHLLGADKLPALVDLSTSPFMPPVYDQGDIGSCVLNALGALDQFIQNRDNPTTAFMPSRLFMYFNTRVVENDVANDDGCTPRDAIKTMQDAGVCPETLAPNNWPYVKENLLVQPPDNCVKEAQVHKVVQYEAIPQDLDHIRSCLASGRPFVFGMQVYAQMESEQCAKDGIVEIPGVWARYITGSVGGHGVLAVGYDDAKKLIKVRNSWSDRWGDKGYFYLPYDYITDTGLCDDFWTIDVITKS